MHALRDVITRCDVMSYRGLAGAMPRVFKPRLVSMRPVVI